MNHNKKIFKAIALSNLFSAPKKMRNNIRSLRFRYGSLKYIADDLNDEYIDGYFDKNGLVFDIANIKEKALKKINDNSN